MEISKRILIAIGLVIPFLTLAQTQLPTSLETIMSNLAYALVLLIFFLAVFFLIMAGFQYLTAGGDPAKVETATRQLIYAVIGLGVAALSWAIINFVRQRLGV